MDQRQLDEAGGYYVEEHSEVSVLVLHMSELLSSFVRDDPPEKRAAWLGALTNLRNSIITNSSQEEVKNVSDFSVMLEEGLQCMADKYIKLQQSVNRKHGYAYGSSASLSEEAIKKRENAKVQLVACDLCDRSIPRVHYYNHLRQSHKDEFAKIAKFRCEYCESALFIKEAALKNHIEVCEVRLEQVYEQQRIAARMPANHQLICRMCEAEFSTIKELCVHSEHVHPHCQVLTCTGCALLFRQPEQIVEHWRVQKEKFKGTRCANNAPAQLVPRNRLIGQVLARAKAAGADKHFAYVACLTQDVACKECKVICGDFLSLYNHIHRLHSKVLQASLSFACLGCGLTCRSAPGIRDHLLRSEVEGVERCNNAGAAYWDEQLATRDMRPSEATKMNETMRTAIGTEEEDNVPQVEVGTSAVVATPQLFENRIKIEPLEANTALVAQAQFGAKVVMAPMQGNAEKKMKIEPHDHTEEAAGGMENEENKKIKIRLKRTPAGMEIDDSMSDMPSLANSCYD